MARFEIFLVEDDPWYGELLKYHLTLNPDFEVSLFTTAKQCLDQLYRKPSVVCVDFGLPDMTGDRLLARLKVEDEELPVVIISGQEDIAVAVNLLKAGATDYIVKDDNAKDLLWNAIVRIRETKGLRMQVEDLKSQLTQRFDFENLLIGKSLGIQKTYQLVEKSTRTNINVSISGETGTGKEVVAQAIHYHSSRKKHPFVAVNMAAIPKDLIESELFGYEKGAFTGAIGRKSGRFEEAQGGTLFLDEIAELDISLQSKILRVLQEREVVRVGGHESVKLDFRLITATHKNLAEEVKKGNFREDLYYRIMGLPIVLPPLRERGSDTLLLAKHFVDEFSKFNKMKIRGFTVGAKEKLMKHSFPGNVRELKATVELACAMADGNEISEDDITFLSSSTAPIWTYAEKTLHEYEIDIITYFLKVYQQNVVLTAEKLGIGKSTIYKLIQNKEIQP